MEIVIEKYARYKSDINEQAEALNRLVLEEQEWLKQYRLDTYRGYDKISHAKKRIRSVGSREDITAVVFREKTTRRALGIGTVILDACVEHPDPEIGKVEGNNLDYWLKLESTEDDHKQATELLVAEGTKPKRTRSADNYGRRITEVVYPSVFTAVQEGEFNPPIGLMGIVESVSSDYRLTALGGLARLMVPEGYKDTYKIAAIGEKTQLYTKEGRTEIDF